MKLVKKVLPAAILLGLAGAAQAQVSIYGVIDVSYGKNEFVGDTKATLHSGGDEFSSQGNSTTRIGVKGSTDVGSGVMANFRFETGGIDSAGGVNGGGNFFNRQAWFGLSGAFGEVRAGRQDSIPFQVMGQFDFNGQSNGVTSAYSGVGVWATNRQSRALQYISPDMGGFKAQLGIAPKDGDNNTGNAVPASSATEKATSSAAVTYAAGDLLLGASYESKRTTTSEDFASVAATYDFKVAKVMAGYTDGPGLFSGFARAKGPTLGVVAPVAGFSVGAHYAKDNRNDKDAVVELFVNKEVFKNTYGYAEFGRMSSDAAAKDGDQSAAVGVIYVF